MNQTPKISVIVAAYNAERYIGRCLDSILAQTMSDFEVIVVNDGSTDGTPAILDGYASKDPRVHVIHKENGGVASARQAGLDAAQGEYTIHADSDDWVEPEMLEELYRKAREEELDMIICDYWEVFNEGEKYNCQEPISSERRECFGEMMNRLAGSLCNKLIRRCCYTDYNIRFDPDVRMEEDKLVCLKILSHDIRVGYINKAFYHYDHTMNEGSLSNTGSYHAESRVLVLERIADYCDISQAQDYYDGALFYCAYEAISVSHIDNRTFGKIFKPHYKNLMSAKGFPLRTKLIVLLKTAGVGLPIAKIKRVISL